MAKDDWLYMTWVLFLLVLGTLDLARPDGSAVPLVAWSSALAWLTLVTVWFARRRLRQPPDGQMPVGGARTAAILLVGGYVFAVMTIVVWDYNTLPLVTSIVAVALLALGLGASAHGRDATKQA